MRFRHLVAVSFPMIAVWMWSATAGCAHGGDDPTLQRGDERSSALPDADVDASHPDVVLFPSEGSMDAGGDVAIVAAIDPHPDVDVALDAGTSLDADAGSSTDACQGGCVCTIPVTLSYDGPAFPGTNWVEAWWQPPGASPRPWGVIPECTDLTPSDGRLDCTFSVPCGTSSLEFQVYLPFARYWGDMSCTSGGCGSTVGTVILRTPSGPLSYVMIPNPWGDPWRNGFAAYVY